MAYWDERLIEEQAALWDKAYLVTGELKKEYARAAQKVVSDMTSLYLRIQSGTATANDLYKYNRLYKMLAEINKELKKLNAKEVRLLNSDFTKLYNDNAEMLRREFGFTSKLSKGSAAKVIGAIWAPDELNWSKRCWIDKAKLAQQLEKGLIDIVVRGASRQELIKEIREAFDASYYRADRLVRTELSYVQTQSTLEQYKAEGIDRYVIIDAGDYPGSGVEPERECKVCHDLSEGGPYPIEDAKTGVNLPPIHPNCRCAIAPWNKSGIVGYLGGMTDEELQAEKKRLQSEQIEKNVTG